MDEKVEGCRCGHWKKDHVVVDGVLMCRKCGCTEYKRSWVQG